MPKPEWGTKQICPECGAKFYDFKKDPIHCPKCDHEWAHAAPPKPRRGAKAKAKEAEAEVKEAEETDELEEDELEDDGTQSLDEVASGEKSKRTRAPGLDDDGDDDDDDEEDLPDLGDGDIAVELEDDEEDDPFLSDDDDDEDDDLSDVIPGGKTDDD